MFTPLTSAVIFSFDKGNEFDVWQDETDSG